MSLPTDVDAVRNEREFAVEIQVAIGLDLDVPDDDFGKTGILDFVDIVGRVDVERPATEDPGIIGLAKGGGRRGETESETKKRANEANYFYERRRKLLTDLPTGGRAVKIRYSPRSPPWAWARVAR